MLTHIPKLAHELGIDFKGYEELAKNIQRMSMIPLWQRIKILERADSELPLELRIRAYPLVEEMAYDRQVYEIAGLEYSKGPPAEQKLFITALADYLLRHK